MDQARVNETDPGATDRIIAEELERLLDSPMFTRSPVLSRLLQFLVEHRLRGGRSAPKAYAIATEGLGIGVAGRPGGVRIAANIAWLIASVAAGYAMVTLIPGWPGVTR